jgi:hypothetical protein
LEVLAVAAADKRSEVVVMVAEIVDFADLGLVAVASLSPLQRDTLHIQLSVSMEYNAIRDWQ